MHVITGITGRVGGQAARVLRGAGLPVRGVMRDQSKAAAWPHTVAGSHWRKRPMQRR